MPKLLLIGAAGRLGGYLAAHLQANTDYEIVRQSRSAASPGWVQFDPRDCHELGASLDAIRPDAVVNAAALTDVDYCQLHPIEAYTANAAVVDNLARWIELQRPQTRLIHISTDHVYGGTGYQAEADVKIVNFYAYTKYIAEHHAAKCINHLNIRTNFFGNLGVFGRQSYSDWIVGELEKGAPLKLRGDCFFNPVSIEFLSNYIAASLDGAWCGTFNLGSRRGMSKYQFGRELARLLHFPIDMIVETFAGRETASVARPLDMRMHTAKIEIQYGRMPELLELLTEVANERAAPCK